MRIMANLEQYLGTSPDIGAIAPQSAPGIMLHHACGRIVPVLFCAIVKRQPSG